MLSTQGSLLLQRDMGLKIAADTAGALSWVSHQNAYPALSGLRVRHDGTEPLEGLELILTSEPALVRPKTWKIEKLYPNASLEIPQAERGVSVDSAKLKALSEAVRGELTFRLLKDGLVLAELRREMRFLEHAQWGGLSTMPELLAGFSMPNAPEVQEILRRAGDALEAAGERPAIDGYLSQDRQRVWRIGAAIWSAVSSLRFSYAVPPASFEQTGQKIRTPARIFQDGLATCLDSTMLFASALEQAGVDPIILLPTGHAFVGFWLRPSEERSILSENAEQLRADIALGNLVVFETTLATQRSDAEFTAAIKDAETQLALDAEKRLEAMIDVRRARDLGILPLDAARRTDLPALTAGSAPAAAQAAPALPAPAPKFNRKAVKSRLESWRRKLLDLSRRNRLLNLPDGDTVLPIKFADPDTLAGAVTSEEPKLFAPAERLVSGARDNGMLEETGLTKDRVTADLLTRGELFTGLGEGDLEKRLNGLLRRSRAAVQETGVGVLHLALGFMRWKDQKTGRLGRAPLILFPVALKRQGARGKIMLVAGDDAPRFNATLLELMRRDIGLEIPNAEALVAEGGPSMVRDVFLAAHRAVHGVQGYEVDESAAISTFSFAKILMWRDLTELEEAVGGNRLLRHLIESPRDPYAHARPVPPLEALDEALPPEEDWTILPADGSQKRAVLAASRNQDFVLEGPPGTGKSQTIANIIAQCMAQGRSVLFVSAKTAALDVVQRRLRQSGLGDLCLEIHSAKARKEAVLAQLRRALEAQPTMDEPAREKLARDRARVLALRRQLNRFRDALHRRDACGLSPYGAITAAIRQQGAPSAVTWTADGVHPAGRLEEMRRLLRRIDAVAQDLGGLASHPLRLISPPSERMSGSGVALTIPEAPSADAATDGWSEAWRRELVSAAQEMAEALPALSEGEAQTRKLLGLKHEDQSSGALQILGRLSQALADPTAPWVQLALGRPPAGLEQAIDAARRHAGELASGAAELAGAYDARVWEELDMRLLSRRWSAVRASGWPWAAARRRAVIGQLQAYALRGVDPDAQLPILLKIWKAHQALARMSWLERATLGLFEGASTDFAALERALSQAAALRATLSDLRSGEHRGAASNFSSLHRRLSAGARSSNPLAAEQADLQSFAEAFSRFEAAQSRFERRSGVRLADLAQTAASGSWLNALKPTLAAFSFSAPQLRAWRRWLRLKALAEAMELGPVVGPLEAGALRPGEAVEAFDVAFKCWWAEVAVDHDQALSEYEPATHRVAAIELGELEETCRSARTSALRDICLARRPELGELGVETELKALRTELERRQGGPALRSFLSEVPTLLPRLTPCVLMSPMSIAQHLDVAKTVFDVVIFDEASQVTTHDAVGAIARGRQTIIVGDPKQLPPTSFFDRQDGDAEDDDGEEDMESILDEAVAANLPKLTLDWHYRSADESLIAFSNQAYYGGRLVTFPGVRAGASSVLLQKVDGRYGRGASRTNAVEAKALVSDLLARLREEIGCAKPRSFAVVTFNSEQQRLIEDLLEAALREEPGLEPFFAEATPEPVVVKNLESIQGDERDVVFFSVTFGPDEKGDVAMNFGPLNKQGGERRLNVAITRARRELVVYSSLAAADIDASRTDAQGVRDFRRFLEFAENGGYARRMTSIHSNWIHQLPQEHAKNQSVADVGDPRRRQHSSGILIASGPAVFAPHADGSTKGEDVDALAVKIAAVLTDLGYQVQRQVGLGKVSIDLAVLDPQDPDRRAIAIEVDGPSWAVGGTALDREKTRKSVLEQLGWVVRREQALEWWRDPEGAEARLTRFVERRLPPPVSAEPAAGLKMVWDAG